MLLNIFNVDIEMITYLYAGILSLLSVKLALDCISARKRNSISLGMGTSNEIENVVSAHSNFTSYAMPLLFLTYLIETSQLIPAAIIHLLALSFTIGRFLHYFAFRNGKMNFKFRVMSMKLTLYPLMVLAIINIGLFIYMKCLV